MRGFCTRCKEDRGDGEEWGIHFWENFPMCDKCGALLDITMSTNLDQKKTMLDKLLYGIAAEPEKFEELREALIKICNDSQNTNN